MSDDALDRPSFPRGALLAAGALIAVAFAIAIIARLGGIGSMRAPDTPAVESRQLRFEDRPDGAVAVHDVDTGRIVDVLQPGTYGFVRTMMRGLARERRLKEIGPEPSFRLLRLADGRLFLEDTGTGRRIDLGAFGRSNTDAFARLLKAGGSTR